MRFTIFYSKLGGQIAGTPFTGLLVVGGGRYLQVIEGPPASVQALYDRIVVDVRHVAVASFLIRQTASRSFGAWSMAYRRQTAAGELNSFVDVLTELTREIPDTSLKQQIRHFAETMMTAGPAWDMLLELYRTELQQLRVSVTDLCEASRVPYTTALRWMTSLESEGLLSRDADALDRRRIYVSLTSTGSSAMATYFGIGPAAGSRVQ